MPPQDQTRIRRRGRAQRVRLAEQQLRRRCDRALHEVVIPMPWNLDRFLADVARRRGRPIVLSEESSLSDVAVSAQWWKEPDADVIMYAPTQSVFYLELNVFHEVGHMLRGHDTCADDGTPFAPGDLERLTSAPGAAATIFSRDSRFDSTQEREAELTAYRLKLMVERVGRAVADDDAVTAHMRSTMRRTLGRSRA